MSDPLFPLGEDNRLRRARVRARSDSSSPRDRPSSMPRRERPTPEDEQTTARGSLVLTTSNVNVPTAKQLGKGGRAGASGSQPAAWSIPSSSRCPACDNLTCDCQSSRPNRDDVKQKLESLRLSTPYERAKLMRATEELRAEEHRRRHRLVDGWSASFLRLQGEELTGRLHTSLVRREAARRESIAVEEVRDRSSCVAAVDRLSLASALVAYERASRLAVAAVEGEARTGLQAHLGLLGQLARLRDRESSARSTIALHQGAEHDAMRSRMAHTNQQMRADELARLDLWKQSGEARDAVGRQWMAGLEQLAGLRQQHARWVTELMHRRWAYAEAALRSVRELGGEEAHARRCLHHEMREDADMVAERVRLFARSCQSLVRTEAAGRQGVAEEMTASLHSIFIELQSDAEEAAEREKLKARRREAEAKTGFAHLEAILTEEADAFEELLSLEMRERDLRYQWVAGKEGARASFAQQALLALHAVAEHEEAARKQLVRATQQAEMDAQGRVARRDRLCRDLWIAAVAKKTAVQQDEHDGRFRLFSVMAEHEESIRRWGAFKDKAVADAAAAEDDARGHLCFLEEAARDQLCVSFASAGNALERRARDLREGLAQLARASVAALRSIEAEADAALTVLLAQHSDGVERAAAAARYRAQLELQLWEGQRRAAVTAEEGADRAGLSATRALAERYLSEEARHALEARIAEVVAAEQSARGLIVRAIEQGYEAAYQQERAAQLRAITAEEERIAAEIRARERCLEEDSRRYPEFECESLPVVQGDGGDGGVRAAPREDPATATLKLELVLQALNVVLPEAGLSAMSGRAVDYLVAVVDGINTRRAEARERLSVLERAATGAARRAQQQEELYLGEREKKETNAARLERDGEDQERRLQNDRLERLRGTQQLDSARTRLDDVLAQLDRKKADLDKLKASINKQFGRA